MSNLDLAIYFLLHFPPGTLIRLSSDYPDDQPHEVTGINMVGDTHYLMLRDGSMVCADRQDLIQKVR